jgi:hypothetical protein
MNFIYREPISERDLKLFREMKDCMADGYVPLKRIILDEPVSEEKLAKWRLNDRQHLAKWKLRKIQKKKEFEEKREKRDYMLKVERISYLLNFEYETLYINFWREAPIMRPYQRPDWFKYRWPEYYWMKTKYMKEITDLGEDTALLWFDVPNKPTTYMSKL